MARIKRQYTKEFMQQVVNLGNGEKPRSEIIKEYELTSSAFSCWIIKYNNTGPFTAKDNRTPNENELIEACKELKQLRMENDILKQAALITTCGSLHLVVNAHD